MKIDVRWNGNTYTFVVSDDTTLGDVQEALSDRTGVLVHRQKIIGLGVKHDETTLVSEIDPSRRRLMLIGSLEEDIEKVQRAEESELRDWQVDICEENDAWSDCDIHGRYSVSDMSKALDRLAARSFKVKIDLIRPPREGKRLLVLDIDYTIYNHVNLATKPSDCIRPG
mmetsp:Transcript_40209/g.159780  ORF Transcript_40209/g.159780 Transcript_40209/m.159780 type:complete len:169 (-) Transcript_40209:2623-3129(-)